LSNVTDSNAFSVSELALAQEKPSDMRMSLTWAASFPEPVFTCTLPVASIVVRSLTFSTASFAVGVQTPLVQLMFDVGVEEILTSACAVETKAAAPSNKGPATQTDEGF
jgi:energy-converting hydrogenase Eha subunit A